MGSSSSKTKEVKNPNEIKDPNKKNAAEAKINDKDRPEKDAPAADKPLMKKPAARKKVQKEYYDGDDRMLPIDKSSRFSDKSYLGEKFPKPYGVVGPLKFERFTDKFCLFIFALYMLAFIIIGVFSVAEGNIDALGNVMDSEGRRCGIDSEYERFPKLLMFKFDSPYKSVCVDECPIFDYNQMKFNSSGTPDMEYIQPVYYDNLSVTVETCKAKSAEFSSNYSRQQTQRKELWRHRDHLFGQKPLLL